MTDQIPEPAPNPFPQKASHSQKGDAVRRAGALLQKQMGLKPTQNQAVPGSAPLGEEGEPAPAARDQQVPYSRFEEVITERNSLREGRSEGEAALKKSQQENADLRKQLEGSNLESRIMERLDKDESMAATEDVDPDTRQAVIARIVAEEVSRSQSQQTDPLLKEIAAERELYKELGDASLDRSQMALLAEIKTETNLSGVDCLALAMTRHPSAFPQSDERGFNPSVHGAPIPPGGRSSNRNAPTELQKRTKAVNEAIGSGSRQKVENALAGLIGERMRGAWGRTKGSSLYAGGQ